MEEYKSVDRYLKKNKQKQSPSYRRVFLNLLNKILLSVLLLVATLCVVKIDPGAKDIIYKRVYQDNFSFAQVNQFYEKYFGSLFPVEKILVDPTKTVFDEKLVYEKAEKYQEGVKLTVSSHYLVPVLESGIVVFIGNKDNYGKTIIVQQVDGVDIWYVNVESDTIKLYDYVEKGSLLGECVDQKLYLYYQKSGEFLDYQEYLP